MSPRPRMTVVGARARMRPARAQRSGSIGRTLAAATGYARSVCLLSSCTVVARLIRDAINCYGRLSGHDPTARYAQRHRWVRSRWPDRGGWRNTAVAPVLRIHSPCRGRPQCAPSGLCRMVWRKGQIRPFATVRVRRRRAPQPGLPEKLLTRLLGAASDIRLEQFYGRSRPLVAAGSRAGEMLMSCTSWKFQL